MSRDALNPRQFPLEGLHPSLGGSEVPDVIRGRVARHVFAQANVRLTRKTGTSYGGHDELVPAPHLQDYYGGTETEFAYRPHHEELWTSQSHLHMPTLQRYARGDIPQHEYDQAEEWDPDYEPETYEHGGKRWLSEGHHRTVASRLAR